MSYAIPALPCMLIAWICVSGAPLPQASTSPLARQYTEGESARYTMTGSNQGRERTFKYTAEAESTVKRDDHGRFYEEFRWTRLTVAGQDVPLDEASANFRQRVSLDANFEMTPPPPEVIAGLNPMLIGPVFDLMTFYVDLHPSLHQNRLHKIGDRVRVPHGKPNSWADGTNVILGEDCIDFELALKNIDDKRATLQVRHVPPGQTSVKLPAKWMHERINPEAPNNWVQVQRNTETYPPGTGRIQPPQFIAAAGHEIFDVLIEIERPTGRIISAVMDNPVDVIQRHCADESLEHCGDAIKFQIRRRIELRRAD